MKGLFELAVKTPQCWDINNIEVSNCTLLVLIVRSLFYQTTIKIADDADYISEKELGCKILYKLSTSLAVQQMISLAGLCESMCVFER